MATLGFMGMPEVWLSNEAAARLEKAKMIDCLHSHVYDTGRDLDEITRRFFQGGECIDCRQKVVINERYELMDDLRICVVQDNYRIGRLYRRRE